MVRHGESEASAARRLAGQSDPPLTGRGRAEAARLRPRLEGETFAGVWSSDLARAVETARLAWGEVAVDRRLRELDFGDYEGRSYDDVGLGLGMLLLRFRDFAVPGGESHGRLRTRVHEFLAPLRPGRHLVFSHGGVIRVLTQEVGLDRFVPTASVVRLDWTSRRLLGVDRPGDHPEE